MKKPRQHTTENVAVCASTNPQEPDLILTVTPDSAGWYFISFQARRLGASQDWSFRSGENELAIVVLCGAISVRSNRGKWNGPERQDVGPVRRRRCTYRAAQN